jgi:GntR family transcriptional regulator
MAIDKTDRRPAYVQVADLLRSQIRDGVYRPGERLPSVRSLATLHEIAPETAKKGVGVLRAEGLVGGKDGNGSVVLDVGEVPLTVQEQLDDLKARVAALENSS